MVQSSKKILLTGITGNTGRVIAHRLQEANVPFVAMVRSHSKVKELQNEGIEAVFGDYDDPKSLPNALQGIDLAYLVAPPDYDKLADREGAFIEAAKQAGVRHVVKCSVMKASAKESSTPVLHVHGIAEDLLRESGMDWTILRPVYIMQTVVSFCWDMITKAGALPGIFGNGRHAYIDARNISDVAVKVLMEPEKHKNKVYTLTGPEAITMHEVAQSLEEALGRRVSYVNTSEWEFFLLAKLFGLPDKSTKPAAKILRMVKNGEVETVESSVTDMGIAPIGFKQFAKDYAAGVTVGGNSFKPPDTNYTRALTYFLVIILKIRFLILGRPTPMLKV